MREIKFRAWSKTSGIMYDRVLAGPGDPCSIVWDEELKLWINFDEHCGDIMQYTGLKDKNGKEIYEGDIVKSTCDSIPGIFKIVFEDAGFIIDGDAYQPFLGEFNYRHFEVIGNIYEHPHLLRDSAIESTESPSEAAAEPLPFTDE